MLLTQAPVAQAYHRDKTKFWRQSFEGAWEYDVFSEGVLSLSEQPKTAEIDAHKNGGLKFTFTEKSS